MDRELSDAADHVRTILPAPMSRGNIRTDWRFVPSASLGGDAFGYHWLDGKRLALYLIDVSGHGARPALLSVSVVNALRSHALPDTDFYSPANVLDMLNKAFPNEQNNAMFFTMQMWPFSEFKHYMAAQDSDLGGTMDRLMAHVRALSDSDDFSDDFTILGIEIG